MFESIMDSLTSYQLVRKVIEVNCSVIDVDKLQLK